MGQRITIQGNDSREATHPDLVVRNGSRLKISTTGMIGSGVFLSGQNDANGWSNHHSSSNFPLPFVPPYSLIGRIEVDGDPGEWRYIGKNFDQVVQGISGDGRLFLKKNDENHQDNTGYFDIDIEIENDVLVIDKDYLEVKGNFSYETAINVELGDKLIIQTEGFIWAGVWFTGENGPEGWAGYNSAPLDFPSPRSPIYSLLGKVGDGNPFYIGRRFERTFNSGSVGKLHLLINDKEIRDNTGSFKVSIQKIRSSR